MAIVRKYYSIFSLSVMNNIFWLWMWFFFIVMDFKFSTVPRNVICKPTVTDMTAVVNFEDNSSTYNLSIIFTSVKDS